MSVVRLYQKEPRRLMNTIDFASKFKNFKYDLSTEEGRVAAAWDQARGWQAIQGGEYEVEVGEPEQVVFSKMTDSIIEKSR